MGSWLIVRTRPRWEKKVFNLLKDKGLEVFCPVQAVRRQWSDRVKLVYQPVFNRHVFVKVAEEERTAVRLTPGVMNFLVKDCRPVLIKEKTIRAIKRLQLDYFCLETGNNLEGVNNQMLYSHLLFIEEMDIYLIGLSKGHLFTTKLDFQR